MPRLPLGEPARVPQRASPGARDKQLTDDTDTEPAAIDAGSPWRITLRRFRRDRLSLAAAIGLALIVFLSFAGGPIARAALGHNGTDLFPYAVNQNMRPAAPWTRVPVLPQPVTLPDGALAKPPHGTPTTLFLLGADGALGRDELIRLLDGGRTSIEIGLGAVLIALLVGLPLGCVAGYFGGFLDAGISRLTELMMAFPLILFLVFASARLSSTLNPIALGSVVPSGVVAVALIIGLFTSFYPLRLVRAQLLTLRDAEFVEGERMIGASNSRILLRHLLPHLLPTLIVWGAIAVGTNILLEVGLSFIGVGVQPSTPTWGSMLSTTWGTIYSPHTYDSQSFTIWLTVFPTAAIVLSILSLNQVAEGLRKALDPKAVR